VQHDLINLRDAAEKAFVGTYTRLRRGEIKFDNNGTYVPTGELDDLEHRRAKFYQWWEKNRPPMKSELPKTDEESLEIKLL
jgi:hypothetical protein